MGSVSYVDSMTSLAFYDAVKNTRNFCGISLTHKMGGGGGGACAL